MKTNSISLLLLVTLLQYNVAADAETSNSPKIIIVGAGASGIAAASKLLENGFDNVIILEAENRIGGRVYTTEFDGYTLDLGAQWVHGQAGNPVYELANPLGLLETSVFEIEHQEFYDSFGDLINPEVSKNLTELCKDALNNTELLKNHLNSSIGNYVEKIFDEYFTERPELNDTLKNEFLNIYSLIQTTMDPGDSWYDVSVKGYLDFEETSGSLNNNNWKDRGYGTVLDILMKKIPDPTKELPVENKTILSTEVTKIDYNSDGPITIKTINNDYQADHVIVTVSLGVMKEDHKTLFDPPLPESNINSIEGLKFGAVGKIFISFEDPWWDKDKAGFLFYWNEEEKKKIENDPEKRWLLSIVHIGYTEHRPRLLSGWISPKGMRDMENLPHDKVLEQLMETLHKFLGKSYNITEPSKMLRSKWYTNKHFRGTYSYHSLESIEKGASTTELREPILRNGKPIVQFAGEATADNSYSTVHGAVLSGWREANRLINLYKN